MAGLAIACGCQTNVRIPDAPPPVDLEPVTPLAGYGMELRLWALDAASWKRIQNNTELARLYEQWQAIEAARAEAKEDQEQDSDTESEPGAASKPAPPFAASKPAGPPLTEDEQLPESFEAYVRTHRADTPTRPGMDVLASYAELRGAIDPAGRDVWERNGLQLALVPISELADLRGAMGVPGPLERTWWGATTTWSHMAKGAAAPNRRLETDMGPLVLGPGRLGLVGRAWAAPGTSKPVLRLELCPQFLPVKPDATRLEARLTARLVADDSPPNALDDGPVFERLLLRGSIPRGYALVIAPAEPAQAAPAVGPALPASSLAEALLTTIGPDGSPRPVALIVVPVLPEWFSLDGG
ncbi:MAG: hypothetical protein ACIAQU_12630 [Phycisphaerales bacterium JB064]